MDEEARELYDLDVRRVDLVGKAANKRKWLLFKSADEEPEPEEPEMPAAGESEDEPEPDDMEKDVMSKPAALRRRCGFEDTSKSDETNPAMEGGEPNMAEENTNVQPESVSKTDFEALQKELNDAKAESTRQAEALEKAQKAQETLQAVVKAQQVAARKRELEPLCKAAGMDANEVIKAEEADATGSAYFLGVIETLAKQVNELLGKEIGSARHNESHADSIDALVKEYQSQHDGMAYADALEAVGKEQPEKVAQLMAER